MAISLEKSLSKIKVVHFHNGSGGGVLSVIKNLMKYSTNESIENHVIYTINKDIVADYKMPVLEGVIKQQVFYYSAKWNFYYTCKQLAKLLPDAQSILVAHDWLELGMMSNLGLQNPVVQIVHGNYDYYFNLAQKNAAVVDQFICISPAIFKNLIRKLPKRENTINYCRFPVPQIRAVKKENQVLRVFYCVRRLEDDNKQFYLLPKINAILKEKNIVVDWTIIGKGIEKEEIEKLMDQKMHITVLPFLTNEEVIKKLTEQDVFILPSLKEGFPVALVEAMKAGLVPLVTNWDGATEELILHGKTGFYCAPGNAIAYAEAIELLNDDREMLKNMSKAGLVKANKLFDPVINTKGIEELVLDFVEKGLNQKKAVKVYGSRMDQEWIPNFITYLIRRL